VISRRQGAECRPVSSLRAFLRNPSPTRKLAESVPLLGQLGHFLGREFFLGFREIDNVRLSFSLFSGATLGFTFAPVPENWTGG